MADKSRKPKNSVSVDENVVCRIAPKKSVNFTDINLEQRHRRNVEAGRISSGVKANEPNDVWTVDFKGWWHTLDGRRCEPLTVRDEMSRYILEVRSMATGRKEAVRAVFQELFEEYGLPKVIRSDNGAPFSASSAVLGLSQLSVWWVPLGIDLENHRTMEPMSGCTKTSKMSFRSSPRKILSPSKPPLMSGKKPLMKNAHPKKSRNQPKSTKQ